MKFIDEALIEVLAGDGGNGAVSFRREKYVPRGGPDGGDGGNGGSIVVRAQSGISTLMDVKYRRRFQADSGEHGRGKQQFGKGREDVVIWVPAGTLVFDSQTKALLADLVREGEEIIVAKGGKGGKGNARFATSTRQAPRIAKKGVQGQQRRIRLELKLLADVGLIGFPNAGKSTLIAAISNARPKIADYPFTTKAPHLGVVSLGPERNFVVADIPGLIEGAHEGAGMGIQFLKHIERTRAFLHLIDVTNPLSPDPLKAYEIIRKELKKYHAPLVKRPEIIVLTKMDLPEVREFSEETSAAFRKKGKEVVVISAASKSGLEGLLRAVETLLTSHH